MLLNSSSLRASWRVAALSATRAVPAQRRVSAYPVVCARLISWLLMPCRDTPGGNWMFLIVNGALLACLVSPGVPCPSMCLLCSKAWSSMPLPGGS